jgi:1-acyl-sn-glycerol-3-phosphate acyltransferase
VDGRENVPPPGPFILIFNHVHLLDSLLLLAVFPRQITFLVASKWNRWPISIAPASVGAIYVNRGQVDREALRRSLRVLEQGGALGISPEGTRSHTPGMQRARPGVAYIANKANVPILPVGVVGLHKVRHRIKRLRRARVQVIIGSQFELQPMDLSGLDRHERLEQASDESMYRLARLLPREYRGMYQLE